MSLALDVHICNLLGERKTPKEISKKLQTRFTHVTDIYGAMLVRSFGMKIELEKENFANSDLLKAYQEWLSTSRAVHASIKTRSPVEHHPVLTNKVKQLPVTAQVDFSALFEAWKLHGVASIRNPFSHSLPEELVKYAENTEATLHELALTLYTYFDAEGVEISSLPYKLLPLPNSVAIKTPEGTLSWYDVVMLFGSNVPGKIEPVRTLLQSFPFYRILCQLQQRLNYACPEGLVDQPFQEFTIRLTIQSMEGFFLHDFSHDTVECLYRVFVENEKVRKDLICFISQMHRRLLKSPISLMTDEEHAALEKKTFKELYYASLRALRIRHFLLEQGTRGEELIEWAWVSNRKYIHRLDFFRYDPPNVQREEEERPLFAPSTIIPLINQLRDLYKRNGETFKENALNLAIGFLPLPRDAHEPLAYFIATCGAHRHAIIHTKQVLDYCILDNAKPLDQMEELLKVFQEEVPQEVEGQTRAFFDALPKGVEMDNSTVTAKIQAFVSMLNPPKGIAIDADLFYRALRFFFSGRIIEAHFGVITLYSEEYPKMTPNEKLDLLIRATERYPEKNVAYFEGTEDIDPENSDPLDLFDTLHLATVNRHQSAQTTLALFHKHFMKEEIPTSIIKGLLLHPVSVHPDSLREDHIEFCVHYLKTNSHPFTLSQKLYIFHELLSMQEDPNLNATLQFIPLFEATIGMEMDPRTVTGFLTYHPLIDIKKAYESFETIKMARRKILEPRVVGTHHVHSLPGMVDDPIVHPQVVEDLTGAIAELEIIMNDPKRDEVMYKDPFMTQERIGMLKEYLHWATLPTAVNHLTHFYPKAAVDILDCEDKLKTAGVLFFPPRSAYEALLPVSSGMDIGRSVWGAWECSPTGYLFRFALVSTRNQSVFSGKAHLDISPERVSKEPHLFDVLRKMSYVVLNDVHWDRFTSSNSIKQTPYEEFEKRQHSLATLHDFLYFYREARQIWESFNAYGGDKEDLELPVYTFLSELRVRFRKAVLTHTTSPASPTDSPLRLSPKFFYAAAAKGEVHPYHGGHQVLPQKALDPPSFYAPFYTSLTELDAIFGPDRQKKLKEEFELKGLKLRVTKNNILPHDLDFEVKGKPEIIDFRDRDYEEFVGGPDSFKGNAYAITVQCVFKERILSLRIVYPIDDLSNPEKMIQAISRQIAQLKGLYYEAFIETEEMSQDHHSPDELAYMPQMSPSEQPQRQSYSVEIPKNSHNKHEHTARSWYL